MYLGGVVLGTCCSPVSGSVVLGEVGMMESAYGCYNMKYGVSVPPYPYSPVPVAYSISAIHTITHAHAHTYTHTTQRQGVDNQLICYGAVRLAHEHMHDDEPRRTRVATLFRGDTKSRATRQTG